MSTYWPIGCEQCKEQVDFVRTSIAGVGWMAGAIAEIPEFFAKHEGHTQHLRVFSEHDDAGRYEDYSDFKSEPEDS